VARIRCVYRSLSSSFAYLDHTESVLKWDEVAKSKIGERVRRFLRFLITPAKPIDPTIRYRLKASWVIPMCAGLVFLEWLYFYNLVPYATIPDKSIFWLAFLAWTFQPIVVQWKSRRIPSKAAITLQSNYFIGLGIGGLVLVIASRNVPALLPVIEAAMPGVMAGGIVAGIAALVWQSRNTAK
jgi:hypothetical protein